MDASALMGYWVIIMPNIVLLLIIIVCKRQRSKIPNKVDFARISKVR